MRIYLPKPLHGWREFTGEVGIIVFGVLIALGAQQAAEAINERREASETRAALTQEIAETLAILELRRVAQQKIVATVVRVWGDSQ